MGTGRGGSLEDLVRASAKNLDAWGLCLEQTSPRFVPTKHMPNGMVLGRVIGRGWLDFFGDYKGRFVTFDAKATDRKTAFPLDSVHPHQVDIVARAHNRGAVAFFLVCFTKLPLGPRYFALTWPVLARYWRQYLLDDRRRGRASIPLAAMVAWCPELHVSPTGRLDFLPLLDEWTTTNDLVSLP